MNFSSRKQIDPEDLPPEVILASQSVGRRMLLDKLGVRFRVIVTHVDESMITDKSPTNLLKRRAMAKCDEIVNNPRVYSLSEEGKTLVIAADSMAIRGKKTYGKAEDDEDAIQIVKDLMGKTHVLATATSISYLEKGKEKKRWNSVAETKVTFGTIKQNHVEAYVKRYDFTRFAAGYALNEAPWDLVTKVDGSYTNVIGLPFEELLPILRKLEIIE